MPYIVLLNVADKSATTHLLSGGCNIQAQLGTVENAFSAFWTSPFKSVGKAIAFAKDSGLLDSKCPVCSQSPEWSESLPELDLFQLFDRLSSEVIYLHAQWTVHKQMYRISEETWQNSGHFAAKIIKLAIEDTVCLGISLLLDEPKVSGKETGSLLRLSRELNRCANHEYIAGRLRVEIQSLRNSAASILEHRNHRIAHLNLKLLIDPSFQLPSLPLQLIDDALIEISDLMNEVESSLCDAQTGYQYFDTGISGGDVLIRDVLLGQHVGALFDRVWPEKLTNDDFIRLMNELAMQFGYPAGLHLPLSQVQTDVAGRQPGFRDAPS